MSQGTGLPYAEDSPYPFAVHVKYDVLGEDGEPDGKPIDCFVVQGRSEDPTDTGFHVYREGPPDPPWPRVIRALRMALELAETLHAKAHEHEEGGDPA